jgi:hypothetical protein
MKLNGYESVVLDLGMLTVDAVEDINELFKSKFLDDDACLEHLLNILILYQAATIKIMQNNG